MYQEYLEFAKGIAAYKRKVLNPGDESKACFALCEGDEVEAVYAYCNLHGLWKA